ncbi:hypothetical protein K491DRAFT_677929 [Lophiostoma macrostomum CBS 122681]|uniref:F-box domain-containing protein n=1 Tax=Lophiostoma macrostomum CBS 122681 TaxID=1314788 RepID=A0A6A6TBG1_9PLEO|nr:hypothetical protein K491DRAFT_677929 [Lophiostoma macrostomum CBS 122681]
MATINHLPPELLAIIFDLCNLSFFDLVRLRSVSRYWMGAIESDPGLRKKTFSMESGDPEGAVNNTPQGFLCVYNANNRANIPRVTLLYNSYHHCTTMPVNPKFPSVPDPPATVTFHPVLADLNQHLSLTNHHFIINIRVPRITGLPNQKSGNISARDDLLNKLGNRPSLDRWNNMFASCPPIRSMVVRIGVVQGISHPLLRLVSDDNLKWMKEELTDSSGIKLGHVIGIIQDSLEWMHSLV